MVCLKGKITCVCNPIIRTSWCKSSICQKAKELKIGKRITYYTKIYYDWPNHNFSFIDNFLDRLKKETKVSWGRPYIGIDQYCPPRDTAFLFYNKKGLQYAYHTYEPNKYRRFNNSPKLVTPNRFIEIIQFWEAFEEYINAN